MFGFKKNKCSNNELKIAANNLQIINFKRLQTCLTIIILMFAFLISANLVLFEIKKWTFSGLRIYTFYMDIFAFTILTVLWILIKLKPKYNKFYFYFFVYFLFIWASFFSAIDQQLSGQNSVLVIVFFAFVAIFYINLHNLVVLLLSSFLIYTITTITMFNNTTAIFSSFIKLFAIVLVCFAFSRLLYKTKLNELISEAKNQMLQKKVFLNAKLSSIARLASGIAHEINNPLQILLGNIDLFKKENKNYNNDIIEKFITKQKKTLNRISDIVNHFLIFSRTELAQERVIDIHHEILAALDLAKMLNNQKVANIKIQLDAAEHKIVSKTTNIQQIILNLYTNALDAVCNNQTACIKVHTYNENYNLILYFEDNGIGIKREHIDQVFDSFFTTKDIGEGLGLGLTTVYTLVKQMNGDIHVETQENNGTSFKIIIPVN